MGAGEVCLRGGGGGLIEDLWYRHSTAMHASENLWQYAQQICLLLIQMYNLDNRKSKF